MVDYVSYESDMVNKSARGPRITGDNVVIAGIDLALLGEPSGAMIEPGAGRVGAIAVGSDPQADGALAACLDHGAGVVAR